MKLNVDKVYCCHHPAEHIAPRKNKLSSFFLDSSIDVEWVELGTPEDAKTYDNTELVQKILTKGPLHCRNDYAKATDLSYRLISLILKHNYCFEQQVKNNYENILILEDDADLFTTFSEDYFNKCMGEYTELGLDLLFLGSCCGLHYPNVSPNKLVYTAANLRSRCTHCFVVNINAAKKLLKTFLQMFDSADWQINAIIEEQRLRVGWAEPSVAQMNYESTLK
jgi:hypothetical protein|tara:strand:+ start:3714 stop:4382 length:669 start_codon:yes stop_codon:yes gene_type:complete